MANAKGINTPLLLTDDFAEFMNKDKASRPQVIKAVFAHIKKYLEKGYPKETDDTISTLLHTSRLKKPSDVMSLVSKHAFES